MKNALLIVDIQKDFIPGGALAVPDGDRIIPGVNALSRMAGTKGDPAWDSVILTQDFHPSGHLSFASSHPGRQLYDIVDMPYGAQTLWPDHCVQGTAGVDFASDLDTDAANLIVRKGFRRHIDSYSAFFENDGVTSTGLGGKLLDIAGPGGPASLRLVVVGLATDFCVGFSALDAAKAGFQVVVVRDLVRGIDIDGSVDAMFRRMTQAGAMVTESSDIASVLESTH